jgi:hypothetical protein
MATLDVTAGCKLFVVSMLRRGPPMWNVECSRHVLTPLFSAVVTWTRRQLLALKRAACDELLMWT